MDPWKLNLKLKFPFSLSNKFVHTPSIQVVSSLVLAIVHFCGTNYLYLVMNNTVHSAVVEKVCETMQLSVLVEASWNVMAHAQKPDFVFLRNGRVHLNRLGRQFSRLLAAEVCASAVVMVDTPCSEVVWRVLASHSIRQFPLYFHSRASPCAITFPLESTSVSEKITTCVCQLYAESGSIIILLNVGKDIRLAWCHNEEDCHVTVDNSTSIFLEAIFFLH